MNRIFCDSNWAPEPSIPWTNRIGLWSNACAPLGAAKTRPSTTRASARTTRRVLIPFLLPWFTAAVLPALPLHKRTEPSHRIKTLGAGCSKCPYAESDDGGAGHTTDLAPGAPRAASGRKPRGRPRRRDAPLPTGPTDRRPGDRRRARARADDDLSMV